MPSFQMLIGLPGSGKSTWLKNQRDYHAMVLSTDKHIEHFAGENATTYNEVFASTIKDAEKKLLADLAAAIKNEQSIIWDQTNLNTKTRAKKLAKIPTIYHKEAIVFLTSDKILDIINEDRKKVGRSIPQHIFESMKKNFSVWDIEKEGFNKITYIERE